MKNGWFRRKLVLIASICGLFLFSFGSTMAEELPKVDICHIDNDTGLWQLININGNAVESHFEVHDDAFPGSLSLVTETPLDENCEIGLPACGDCLEFPHAAGCEVAACTADICLNDDFCCNFGWDFVCVETAINTCVGVSCSANLD